MTRACKTCQWWDAPALGDGLLGYCRQGFEPELAAELSERAAQAGFAGYARTERDSGHVLFFCEDGAVLDRALPFSSLIFARQKLHLLAELRELNPQDRIAPMLEALTQRTVGEKLRFGELVMEHPDSEVGKPLAGLARSLGNALRAALRKAGLLSAKDNPSLPRLHICLISGDHALLARSHAADSAPWPLGIPRLRMHKDAPSRSALKLEEALLVLLDNEERQRLLKEGMVGADLGAAPGGWTWVLTRDRIQVTAVDNGPIHPYLLASGMVQHLRADGFSWQPPHPLDWMVCDMVEQPRRVAERMATWLREGWCRHTIFNLKLPMKKRWQETQLCLDLFAQQAGKPLTLRAKQLYHDREEITVFATTARMA